MAPAKKNRTDKQRENKAKPKEPRTLPVARLLEIPAPYNPRTISSHDMASLRLSLAKFGAVQSIIVNHRSEAQGFEPETPPCIVGGHQRVLAAEAEGFEKLPTTWVDLNLADEMTLNVALNRILGEFTDDDLQLVLEAIRDEGGDLGLTGFDDDELQAVLEGAEGGAGGGSDQYDVTRGILAQRFGVPPFTILDTRRSYWQERRRAWMSCGFVGGLGRPKTGRGRGFYGDGRGGAWKSKGNPSDAVSFFDPVLCELTYSWFSAHGASVLDPFAGGPVGGLIAARLGREYTGIDIREIQVLANRAQGEEIFGRWAAEVALDAPEGSTSLKLGPMPIWITGDSKEAIPRDRKFDMIFSCPPYADREVYSDDPSDISAMDWADFKKAYRQIVKRSVAQLSPDRFAVWVVADVRGPDGNYRGLIRESISAFEAAGMSLYNEAILVNSAGSLPRRVGPPFVGSRKLGKMHQNVLVFLKGDAKRATEWCGEVAIGSPEDIAAYSGETEETEE